MPIKVQLYGICRQCKGELFYIQAYLSDKTHIIASSYFCPNCDIERKPREYILDASVPKDIEHVDDKA